MALGYRKLGRNSAMRKALLRDLLTDLIINGRIAKELQRLADKMVYLGKANTLAARIQAAKMVRFEYTDESKEQYAIQKLFGEIAEK
jgi:large subunit ribosomal protein L17